MTGLVLSHRPAGPGVGGGDVGRVRYDGTGPVSPPCGAVWGTVTWDGFGTTELVLSHRPAGPGAGSGDLGQVRHDGTGPVSPPPGPAQART